MDKTGTATENPAQTTRSTEPPDKSVLEGATGIREQRDCSCSYRFGISGSLSENTNVEEVDPLFHLLKGVNLKYRDPNAECDISGPIMEILSGKVKELGLHGSAENPVVSIPVDWIPFPVRVVIPGFPNSPATATNRKLYESTKAFAGCYSESYVHNRIKLTLQGMGQPAFHILNYKPHSYLYEIRERGLEKRKRAAKTNLKKNYMLYPLSEEEKFWAKALSVDLFNNKCENLLRSFLSAGVIPEPKTKKNLDSNIVEKFKEKLRSPNFATAFPMPIKAEEEANFLQNFLYETGLEYVCDEEFDSLIILPDSRQIIEIEVKSVRDESQAVVRRRLTEAAEKMAVRNEVFRKQHRDILPTEWTYVRAVALPMLSSWKDFPNLQVCDMCSEFVLDQNRLKNMENWLRWVKGQGHQVPTPVDDQYQNLLNRIIGFLLISKRLHINKLGTLIKYPQDQQLGKIQKRNEKAVVGSNARGISSEKPGWQDISIFKRKRKSKRKRKRSQEPTHLGSLRTVFLWNRAQLSIMQLDKKKVILHADFGTGKTLLLKSRALQLVSRLKEQQKHEDIYYVSLVSFSNTNDKVSDLVRRTGLFDLETKNEFENSGVKFLSYFDVIEKVGDFSILNTYNDLDKLLKNLVEKKFTRAHFFIDEVPVFCRLEFKRNLELHTWMALTTVSPDYSLLETATANKLFDQKILERLPYSFYFPAMEGNMRNGFQVIELADLLFLGEVELKMSAMKEKPNVSPNEAAQLVSTSKLAPRNNTYLPANTVPGCTPIIIPVDDKVGKAKAIRYTFREYFPDKTQPVIILVQLLDSESRYLKDKKNITDPKNISIEGSGDSEEYFREISSYWQNEMKCDEMDEIFDACRPLMDAGWKVYKYDGRCPDSIREFLRKPEGILITDVKSMQGIQARNVIVTKIIKNWPDLREKVLRCSSSCVLVLDLHYLNNILCDCGGKICTKIANVKIDVSMCNLPSGNWHIAPGFGNQEVPQYKHTEDFESVTANITLSSPAVGVNQVILEAMMSTSATQAASGITVPTQITGTRPKEKST
jgi:hypothetical protein